MKGVRYRKGEKENLRRACLRMTSHHYPRFQIFHALQGFWPDESTFQAARNGTGSPRLPYWTRSRAGSGDSRLIIGTAEGKCIRSVLG
jgi:hypothetical protein